jgi:cytoskeletal protein CcmA (bactofilin family)
MNTNKKFRIQNGVDVKGELTVNDVVIIRADGTIVAGAIADAVSSLVDEGALTGSGSSIVDSDSQIFIDVNSNTVAIASETATRISDIASLQTQIDSLGVNADTQAEVDSLQTQIDSIVGASPETLDTLVEIVSAFEGADSDIQSLLAANSSSLSANTAAIGIETTQRIAGDVTLQQNIDAEVTRASAAELANAAAIAAESATRGAAVSALQASQFTYNDSDGWTGNLIPSADNEYTLGSPDRVWKDLYIGPGSLYINGTKILEDNSGTITMYADAGQNLSFGATGGGNIDLNAGDESVQLKSDLVMSVGETISTVGGEPTKFGGAVDMGTHKVKNVGAPVDASDAATKEYVDSLNADGTITGDKVFEDNVTIEGNLTVEGTTTTLDSQTLKVADNIIDLNSNVSTGAPVLNAGIRIMRGDEPAVQLRWNELEDRWEVYDGVTATPIAVTSTDVIAEGDNKLFFTVVRAREAVSQDIADAVAAEATARGAAIDAEIARATSAEQANAAGYRC